MALRIEKQFTIDASPDAVWAFLTDPARVAQCLPGASITDKIDDHTYAGRMKLKVGPVSTSYKGKVSFERLDRAGLTAVLRATGQDVQGRGGADMTMTSQLAPQDGGTSVPVTSEVNVTGILAQFGRGMIQDVGDQMFDKFTANMRAQLGSGSDGSGAEPTSTPPQGGATPGRSAGPSETGPSVTGPSETGPPVPTPSAPTTPPPPQQEAALDVGALGTMVLGRMAARMLRRPAFWVGLVVVLALIYLLFVR
jgi:carbon monoxide dehydrogenase subunit G